MTEFDPQNHLLANVDFINHPLNSKPAVKWFGVIGGKTRYPREKGMAAKDWGWDATCSCGWDSGTGGALMSSVKKDVEKHKFDHEWHSDMATKQQALKDNPNLGRQFE